MKLDISNNEEYKVKAICNSAIYAKKVRTSITRALLHGFVEGLSQERKYLKNIFDSPIPKKDNQLISQKLSGQADSNLKAY